MKNLNVTPLFALLLFLACNLEPLPIEPPRDSFELKLDIPSSYTSSKLIDGVQLSNGDFVVVGTATKSSGGDAYVVRFDKEGKQILKAKTFDGTLNEEISNLTIDGEENIYLCGQATDGSNTYGLVIKISTKNGDLNQIWVKHKEYGVYPTGAWFVKIFHDNNQLYIVEGLKGGTADDNKKLGLRRLDTTGTPNLAICADAGKVAGFVAVDAAFGNGKIYAGGHTKIEQSNQAAWSTSNLCAAPTRQQYTDIKIGNSTFHYTRSIVYDNGFNYCLSNDIGTTASVWRTIFYKTKQDNLVRDGNRYVSKDTLIPNLKDYEATAMNKGGGINTLVYTASYALNTGDNISRTDLHLVDNIVFNDAWSKKTYNIFSNQVIVTQDGGYIIIGIANNAGKVVKTNSLGDCASCMRL